MDFLLTFVQTPPGQIIYVILIYIVTFIRVIFEIAKHPLRVFTKRNRDQIGFRLRQGPWEHSLIGINSKVRLHLASSGPRNAPVILFVHGFPECWYSWRNQLQFFSKQYRCISFDLRGYGESDKPIGKDNYSIELLTKDIVLLLESLGVKKAFAVVGHDWGAIISYAFASIYPEKLEKLIILNGPHPQIFSKNLYSFPQILHSYYVFAFQIPYLPEIYLALNDFSFLEDLFQELLNKERINEEDIEYYKFSMSRPGATNCTINYYRKLAESNLSWMQKIQTPCLILWGENDQFLSKDVNRGLEQVLTNYEIHYIPDCGHWAQIDSPVIVNNSILEFLKKEIEN